MTKLQCRRYSTNDEIDIVNLYNNVTNRDRTVAQHIWQWQHAFALTPPSVWVITNNDQIVAHHGLMPLALNINHHTVLAGKTENTILDIQLRGTGVYYLYERRFFSQEKKRFDFLFTTSGYGEPGKLRKKLGYHPVAKYAVYAKPLSARSLTKITLSFIKSKLIKNLLYYPLCGITYLGIKIITASSLVHLPKSKRLKFCQQPYSNQLATDIQTLYNRNKEKLGITIIRSKEYIQWRIFNNPNIALEAYCLYQNNELLAYALIKKKRNGKLAVIEDILIENNNPSLYYTFCNKLSTELSKMGVALLIHPLLNAKTFLNTIATKSGFIKLTGLTYYVARKIQKTLPPKEACFMVYCDENSENYDSLFTPEKWYFTGLFKEGIN